MSHRVLVIIAVLAIGFWLLPLIGCVPPGSVRAVVKIGLVAPFEGPQRTMAYDTLFATKLAIRRHNGAGRERGPLVEIVALNDGGQANESRQQALEMVADPAILGMVGPWSAETATASISVYQQARLALVLPDVGSEGLTSSEASGVVRLSADNHRLGARAADYVVHTLSAQRVAVIRGEDDLADAFVQSLGDFARSVVADVRLTEGKHIVEAISAAQPDLLFFSGNGAEAAGLLSTLHTAGMNVPLLAGPAVDRFDFVQMAGPLARGANILCVAPRWQDIGPNQEFVDAFQSLAGRPPSSQAILAYDATNVLLATIRETASAGHLSREQVVGHIRSVRNLSGLTGPLKFDEQGERLEPPIWVRPVNSSQ